MGSAEAVASALAKVRVDQVEVVLETEPERQPALEVVSPALERALPGLKSIGFGSWKSARETVNWWTNQQVTDFTFDSGIERLPAEALDRVERSVVPLAEAMNVVGIIRMAAILVTLKYSSPEPSVFREILCQHLQVPALGRAVDADWRYAVRADERYFLNWKLDIYEERNVSIEAASGRPLPNVTISPPKDEGLRVVIDANTKVNILDRAGPIVVTPAELPRVLAVARSGVHRIEELLRNEHRRAS